MPTVPVLEISWNFIIFSKFTSFHQTFRIYWNHHQKHACEMWAHSEKSTYFKEKCWLCRPFEISWNFNIFSKFTNFHQTCRTYWNHHQKHACEIWAYSEKLTAGPFFSYFFKKISSNLQNIHHETCGLFYRKISWNIHHFFKIHLISSNLQNILESSSETCKWNSSPFREVKFFHRKMPTVPALEILLNFNIFSKFTKFHQTFRTYWNHHQKHACEIWAYSNFFIEKEVN